MKNLDTQYFVLEHKEERGDNIYQVYRPLFTCIGLYSIKDNIPLYTLQLKAKDSENTKSIIYQRSLGHETETLQRFHGMLNKDGQKFSLIVTNTNAVDHVYYNVLRGHSCLNEINLLPPLTSYAVSSDQQAGHMELILRSIEAVTGKSLTVKEDEKTAKETKTAQKGLSVQLTVSPQKGTTLAKLFARPMEWRMVDRLILCTAKLEPISIHLNMSSDESATMSMDLQSAAECMTRRRGSKESSNSSSHAARSNNNSAAHAEKGIEESKAAQLEYGDKVTVQAHASTIEVAFELQAPPCELGLSVATELEFIADSRSSDELKEVAHKLIEAHYSKKYDSFLTKEGNSLSI